MEPCALAARILRPKPSRSILTGAFRRFMRQLPCHAVCAVADGDAGRPLRSAAGHGSRPRPDGRSAISTRPCQTSFAVAGSSLAVGSSAKTIPPEIRLRAIPMRRRCPPDKLVPFSSIRAARPPSSNTSSRRPTLAVAPKQRAAADAAAVPGDCIRQRARRNVSAGRYPDAAGPHDLRQSRDAA